MSRNGTTSRRRGASSLLAAQEPVPDSVREQRTPECTDFGCNREEEWPEYFFCSNCTVYKNDLCTRPLLSRSSNKSKFTCKGGHESFDHPTTKKKTWCRSISAVEEINTEENSKIGNTTPAEDGRRQRKKAKKKGIASYLDQIFKEKEKILTDAS